MKFLGGHVSGETTGRSPHGERGLKFVVGGEVVPYAGRSPHGERGLKFEDTAGCGRGLGRSPHGERGLKCQQQRKINAARKSLSSRRAWIEISCATYPGIWGIVALLTESVD